MIRRQPGVVTRVMRLPLLASIFVACTAGSHHSTDASPEELVPPPGALTPPASERTLANFHAIDFGGGLDVELTIAADTSLDITGAHASEVTARVAGGTLHVQGPRDLRDGATPHVSITAPLVDVIAWGGTGALRARALAGSKLHVAWSGTGQATLSGQVDTVELQLSGTGEIDASRLAAHRSSKTTTGTGTILGPGSGRTTTTVLGTGNIVQNNDL